MVTAELPLPHLVELPARGVGADLIGRAAALLVDIPIDVATTGYRLTGRPGSLVRRARGFLDEDMDVLEEAWERGGHRGAGRGVKIQAPGPVTLAAQLELFNGHRAITDAGAVRDLAASLAEGVALQRAELARRLQAPVAVQFDEPSLPAALAGRLSGVSILSVVHPVDAATASSLFDGCAAAVGGDVAVHCCDPDVPWELLANSAIDAVVIDATKLGDSADLDGLASLVDAGRDVVLGLIPSTAPTSPVNAEMLAIRAARLIDRLGFGRAVLADRIGVAPACGLAGATTQWARAATELTRKVADLLANDPDAL